MGLVTVVQSHLHATYVLPLTDNGERKKELESLGLEYLCCLARQDGTDQLAYRFKSLWDEFEDAKSPVSKVVNQVDLLEAMHQAFQYTKRYPHLDFSDFKSHRNDINDPWLALQADEVLRQWAAFDLRKKSDLIVIFVIGGPGVGKGTQCGLAAEHFGFDHISVGELLRTEGRDTESVFRGFIQESFKSPSSFQRLSLCGCSKGESGVHRNRARLESSWMGFHGAQNSSRRFKNRYAAHYGGEGSLTTDRSRFDM